MQRLVAAFEKAPGVEEVQYDLLWIQRLATAIRLVRGVGALLGGILVLAGVFTISNVIRLTVYARQDELDIMRLVGATRAYVKGPFVVEGMIQGGLGGLISVGPALGGVPRARQGRAGRLRPAGPRRRVPARSTCACFIVLGGMARGRRRQPAEPRPLPRLMTLAHRFHDGRLTPALDRSKFAPPKFPWGSGLTIERRNPMKWRAALAFAVTTLGLSLPARAQEITGTIVGTVTDETGAAVPGATVAVRNAGTGVTREFLTTDTGRYTAPFLPVGEYEVSVSLTGFQPTVVKGIALHVNDRLQVDAALKLGQLTDVVEVTANAAMVQPNPAVQTLMGATQVEELPLNNRNFVQLASLVPGVNSSLADEVGIGLTSTVSVSMAGARRNGVNWLVDGAANVDVGSNITLLTTPSLESIEEFKIITSSYAAEWPRSGGGIVNVVTKSGSNLFRASAYEFFRDDALNANGFFRKQAGCVAGGACSTDPAQVAIRENPAELKYHNFGYTFSGPIKKDSLFFFFSQEFRRIDRAPTSTSAATVNPAWLTDPANPNYVAPALRDPNSVRLLEAYPAPNLGADRYVDSRANPQDTRQEVLRLDWHASPKWRFMGRYTHDLSETTEAGGLFFNTLLPDRRHHLDRRAGPAVRRTGHHHHQPAHAERVLVPVLRAMRSARSTATTPATRAPSSGSRAPSCSRRTARASSRYSTSAAWPWSAPTSSSTTPTRTTPSRTTCRT